MQYRTSELNIYINHTMECIHSFDTFDDNELNYWLGEIRQN